jgi:cytochrome bd ubiquinol oxidase subunit I
MISETAFALSEGQFALAAGCYFLFMPLFLGLPLFLAIFESLYVISGAKIYRQLTQFWGKLFAVSFAVGLISGLVLQFQIGMLWSAYARYVGDIFALPLAISVLFGGFLQAALLNLFLNDRDKLSKTKYLCLTWLLALAAHVSVIGVLIAEAWLDFPLGAEFNFLSLRMELTDVAQAFFNPAAIEKITHSFLTCYVIAAAFIVSLSAYFLTHNKTQPVGQQGFKTGAHFGLAAVLMLLLSSFATDKPAHDLTRMISENKQRVRNGIKAYGLLAELRDDKRDAQLLADFSRYKSDLGYGLLLQKYTEKVVNASEQQIEQAAQDSIPAQSLLSWAFWLMLIGSILAAVVFSVAGLNHRLANWRLKLSLYSLPIIWFSYLTGWLLVQFGRQPWAVSGLLPAFLAQSSLSSGNLIFGLIVHLILFAALFCAAFFAIRFSLKQPLND